MPSVSKTEKLALPIENLRILQSKLIHSRILLGI